MAGKLGRALMLLVLLAAALITQAPLAVFLLAFALVLLVLLRLDAAYLRRQVTAELLVPDKPVIQGEDFTLTVRLRNRSRLPIPALVVLLNAADEWGGGANIIVGGVNVGIHKWFFRLGNAGRVGGRRRGYRSLPPCRPSRSAGVGSHLI